MNKAEKEKKDKELREICFYKGSLKKDFSDYYGIGYWYKKYAGVPEHIPIKLHCDHAPSLQETLLPFDLNSPYQKAFFHNKLKVNDNNKKQRFKKVYIAGSAFVHYRKMHNIKKASNPQGTLCFPMHPTAVVDVIMDYDVYMDELLALPKKFHPFTVCLYYLDIEKGLHHKFLKRGFNVVTAGHMFDEKFPVRFYEFLKTKKYVTSNVYGSFVPYAIEMGIPFFFYGKTVNIKLNNRGDKGAKMGESTLDEYTKTGRKVSYNDLAKKLFKEKVDAPTQEQLEFANTVLGINDQIGPTKLKFVLWREYLLWKLKRRIKKLKLKKRVNQKLKKILCLSSISLIKIIKIE